MSKWNTIIKEKQSRYKEDGIKEVFKKEDGAIDLASIMVGVIVIGVIGGVIAATVFAVIPWSQDNAAKQQLDSIVQAENAYFGLSAATPSPLPAGYKTNSFGKSAELETAKLLKNHPRYCVTTPDDGKTYTGYSQSNSGSIWQVTDKNTKPEIFVVPAGTTAVDSLPADCKFITEGIESKPAPVVPYVDPTPTKTIMTYQCDSTTTVQSPIFNGVGSYTWNDGATSTTSINNSIPKSLTGGVKYTFIFEGTFYSMDSTLSASTLAGAKCIRSLDHWGSASTTQRANNAFYGATNLTDVPDSIPTTINTMIGMFSGASSLNDSSVKNWDVSKVTMMSYMFNNATSFNQDLSNWNTAAVTDMSFMFNGASSMNGSLNGWDTAKVTNMDHMFYGASSFNQDLSNWNTANVTNMLLMFFGAPYSQDLTGWDMNKINKIGFMVNNPDSSQLPRTTHPLMTRITYQCDSTTTVQSPVANGNGTYTWNDGITNLNNNVPKSLTGGVKYTLIFEGTFYAMDSTLSASTLAGAKCIRSLDHWGSASTTQRASNAFYGATNLTDVPDSIPTTINTMIGMFSGASSLNDSSVKNWDVSKVTSMTYMFNGATSLNQDLSNWNTAAVTDMSFMFNEASSMNGSLNGWDTAKVTNMDHMFFGASSFNQDLSNWNTANVTNMLLMFFGAPYSQDLTGWDMNKITKMGFMVNNPDSSQLPRTTHPLMTRITYQCDTTTTVQSPVINGNGTYTWNDGITNLNSSVPKSLIGGVKYTLIFEGTFYAMDSGFSASTLAGAKCIRSLDHWGSASTTQRASNAFYGATNLTDVPDSIPTTITSMIGMFSGASSLNDSSAKNWDVSKVTMMSYMFNNATSFNQDLSNWNTAAVTDMSFMFNGASSMNGSLNGWDTAKVTNMDHMFFGASSFNQPLNNWNTTNVTNMLLMFFGAPYSQDLTGWDMNKITKMGFMVNNPDSSQLPRTTHPLMTRITYQCDTTTTVQSPVINGNGTYTWNDGITNLNSSVPKSLIGGVKYTLIFEGTFYAMDSGFNASTLAGAKCIRSLDHWGSASTTQRASNAFYGATNLTDVPESIPMTITSMIGMFSGASSLNDSSVKNWDVSKVTNMNSMFASAIAFNQDLSGWNTAALTSGTLFAPALFPDAYLPAKTSK